MKDFIIILILKILTVLCACVLLYLLFEVLPLAAFILVLFGLFIKYQIYIANTHYNNLTKEQQELIDNFY